MVTNNKTSVLVDNLLPSFLDEEGPKFQAFVRAYYEWLESTNQVTDRSKNLLNYQDIDRTADDFLNYFKNEVLSSFPETILADKKLLYRRIKDLYRAKGSEQAFKLLFRVLYDEEIDFYYPGNDILRASDGVWVQENSIRISSPFTGSPANLAGEKITGLLTGATALVDRVTSTTEQGVPVFELFLSQIKGTFEDSETVQNEANTISGVIIASVGPLKDVVVTFGGDGHQLGDGVTITSSVGTSANGTVIRTIDNSLNVGITDGGSGYIAGVVLDISGGGGSGAAFTVTSINNTEEVLVYDDTISDLQNTLINANTFITSNTGSLSANLAIANASSVLSAALGTSNITVGAIASLGFSSRGSNYTSLPTVSAEYEPVSSQELDDGSGGIKGFNAVFAPQRVAGSLDLIRINQPGSGYNRANQVTLTNASRANTRPGFGAPLVTGVISYPGGYQDTRGHLSWNNKLQDNYFYQEFSYVLKSSKALGVYKEIVENSIHPAGQKLFGETDITANISVTFSADPYVNLTIENLQSITSTLAFGVPNVVQVISPTSISSTTALGVHELIFNIDPPSITATTAISTDLDYEFNLGGGALIGIDSTLSIGTISVEPLIDPSSITSTLSIGTLDSTGYSFTIPSIDSTTVVSTDGLLALEGELQSIVSTTVVSDTNEVYLIGAGTMSNQLVNDVTDLQNKFISDYENITIDTFPSNRVFDGIGTSFDTDFSAGTVVKILDVNDTGVELTATVDSISDANTFVTTANVAFANGDLAIVTGATYIYTSS